MANYYCKNCGRKYSSIQALGANFCEKHPDGSNKGRHQLYEGSEKSKYDCKYCGMAYHSIQALTSIWCMRHPEGSNKGKHSPAL